MSYTSVLQVLKHLQGKHDQSTHGHGSGGKVWAGGEPMMYDGPTVSKLEAGAIGEKLAVHALSEKYHTSFTTLNVGINNAPIDAGGDHLAVEVKTGLATNGKTAQQWRATIGQPGKAEAELIKQMSSDEKAEYNQHKSQKIMERKSAMLAELTQIMGGQTVKPITVGVILHPSGSKGDLYAIPGFHLRLPWQTYAVESNYLGTFDA